MSFLRWVLLKLGFGWCVFWEDGEYWDHKHVSLSWWSCWRYRCSLITGRQSWKTFGDRELKRTTVMSITDSMKRVNYWQLKKKRPILQFHPTWDGWALRLKHHEETSQGRIH